MYDFCDMITLASEAQDIVDKLDKGQVTAAVDFARHVLTIDVPCVSTPYYKLYTEENAVI